jgi:hypothetical protein
MVKTQQITTPQEYRGKLGCPFPNDGVHDRTILITAGRFCLETEPDILILVCNYERMILAGFPQ